MVQLIEQKQTPVGELDGVQSSMFCRDSHPSVQEGLLPLWSLSRQWELNGDEYLRFIPPSRNGCEEKEERMLAHCGEAAHKTLHPTIILGLTNPCGKWFCIWFRLSLSSCEPKSLILINKVKR